ncbi:hypothetical protein [Kitasatospora sp. NPDC059571]|uniref:hypothetical protein n=1 Tax=Kitasatospora sp. NPDC059571 TaxID=3346871 RepID=UPI0036BE4FC4
MTGRRRVVKRRRSTRTVLIAAAIAATGVFIGTAVTDGVLSADRTHASAAAPGLDAVAASGPAHDEAPQPVASIPADDVPRGLVYGGLKVASKGDRCVGGGGPARPPRTPRAGAPPPGGGGTKSHPPGGHHEP